MGRNLGTALDIWMADWGRPGLLVVVRGCGGEHVTTRRDMVWKCIAGGRRGVVWGVWHNDDSVALCRHVPAFSPLEEDGTRQ